MPSDTVMLVGTLIPILAILLGGMAILIPIAGLTLRFALKPALESFGKLREAQAQAQELRLLEQRLSLVEEQLQHVSQVREWDRSLGVDRPRAMPATGDEG
jgi:hypothetical protein